MSLNIRIHRNISREMESGVRVDLLLTSLPVQAFITLIVFFIPHLFCLKIQKYMVKYGWRGVERVRKTEANFRTLGLRAAAFDNALSSNFQFFSDSSLNFPVSLK